jgi:4-deoxy-L-threo-5-hexosulose-uronate ketol-isomerase
LPCPASLAANFFCERRELGVINLGGKGTVHVDGAAYALDKLDCLYIGRGSKDVFFESDDASTPAQFYLVSYPAHADYPTTLVLKKDVTPRELGSPEQANVRKLHQMIVPGRVQSCQLVMGFTQIQSGSVWNTMPAHTHARRSEVYLYFDIAPGAVVFHLMGEPQETRHLVVHEKEAVLSPAWSIHSGVGTGAYTFVWGMGGENQTFDDMDGIAISDLR